MIRSRVSRLALSVLAVLWAGAAFFTAESAAALGKIPKPPREPPGGAFRPAPLPKKGSIAVLVKGVSEQHNALVAALVSQRLTAKGYKIADPQTLTAIRRSKAAMAALDGDVDALIRINSQYQVGTTITINAQAGRSVVNEIDLYTGTASVAVRAVSGSTVVYSDAVQGKGAGGYTSDEAVELAIEAAALLAVDRMTQ
ncbi:MAG: hypothetical protein LBS00_00600 [Synergistaceae bacterium]|jgi:hypothetical protein|nr:hypothetical protein [Synergistaceae bacterium]